MAESRSVQVLLCAFSGSGHLNPIMVLAEKLALLGLSVTVVLPGKSLLSYFHPGAFEGLDIELVALDLEQNENKASLVMPSSIKRVRKHRLQSFIMEWPDHADLRTQFELLLQERLASDTQPAAVIYDYVLTWASAPAMKLGVPSYAFNAASVCYMSTSFFLRDFNSSEVSDQICVPGNPPVSAEDVYANSGSILDSSNPLYYPKKAWEDQLEHSEGVLLNSSVRLEGKSIQALRLGEIRAAAPFADKLLPIGPLIPSRYLTNSESDMKKDIVIPSQEQQNCRKWLDEQSSGSVVFISFGSWVKLADEQITELAAGLEASKVRFLWVLPLQAFPDPDEYLQKVLPRGFQEETSSRSLIVRGYAPQHLILSHPALTAFVTHCGWNSTLECLSLAGVPVVAWPFVADQPFNSNLLVEELKIGVEVVENADGVVERDEVERVLRFVTEGEDADAMKGRAMELRRSLREAMDEGNELLEFANKIRNSSRKVLNREVHV